MEVEFNWRRFALIVLIVALIAGGAFLLWPRLQGFSQTDEELADLKATLVPEQKVVASDFENQSSWKVEGVEECLPKLQAWIGEREYSLKSVSITLVDTETPEMGVGVAYPHPILDNAQPEAIVTGNCKELDGTLSCQIAVREGESGDALNVASSVELAQLIYWQFRPRTRQGWQEWQRNWKWENFQPLIRKEGNEWKSDCLYLTR